MADIFYPIQMLANFIVSLLLEDTQGSLAASINFFVYDSIKIIRLLFVMISLVGFLRTYLLQHKIKKWLSSRRMGLGNVLAAMFGAITLFCSCSSAFLKQESQLV